ncbi:MAG: superoxide dismutase [Candidatus Marinimicrobia bacterium]|nr:superoxide dismutase [Candidatus Neomarinimicrobiota bacterium]MBT6870603.1 superoxide dismutase [Candidatus Neomarinimicrobiota bacterium]MBT7377201.1 superoxide dismutase [Candidatus Neomarinimicrobiota bacterium]|tara:strand:- start:2621 stop:3109 length:489 start_codon:yes stop_codon:yes gene_type:complete
MKNMIKIFILPLLLLNVVFAHCQIPCGIYDDVLRVVSIQEDIATIQKSIDKIQELGDSKNTAQNQNQLIRWVNNKESHAQKIQDVISEYFLAQRIKPKTSNDKDYEKYVMLSTSCQKIIFYAMKCKQNVDTQYVEKLSSELDAFVEVYVDKHGKEHLRDMRK